MATKDVVIKKCTCKHEYQDQKYGPGMRVHNPSGHSDRKGESRCSVCGNGGRASDRIFKSPNDPYQLDTSAYDKAFPKKKVA